MILRGIHCSYSHSKVHEELKLNTKSCEVLKVLNLKQQNQKEKSVILIYSWFNLHQKQLFNKYSALRPFYIKLLPGKSTKSLTKHNVRDVKDTYGHSASNCNMQY